MTDLKFKLLESLYELPYDISIDEATLLNSFIGKDDKQLVVCKNTLTQMIAQKYVTKLHDGTYRIAIPGINIYEAECAARREKQSDEERLEKRIKKERCYDLYMVLAGAALSLIGSLIFWFITGAAGV